LKKHFFVFLDNFFSAMKQNDAVASFYPRILIFFDVEIFL